MIEIGAIVLTEQTADILFSLGTGIGVYKNYFALKDSNTIWSRKSSLPNVVAYPITALLPLAIMGLWASFLVTLVNFAIWYKIYKHRAPEHEDWKGNITYDSVKTWIKTSSRRLKNYVRSLNS